MPNRTMISTSDVIKNLQEIEKLNRKGKEMKLDKIPGLQDFATQLDKMELARMEYEKDPSDTAKGVIWAKKTADYFFVLQSVIILPPNLDTTVIDFITGYFKAIPIYVNALTGLLERHIQQIDIISRSGKHDITFNYSYGKAECSSTTVDENVLMVIKNLGIPEYRQLELFQKSCEMGLPMALKTLHLMP